MLFSDVVGVQLMRSHVISIDRVGKGFSAEVTDIDWIQNADNLHISSQHL